MTDSQLRTFVTTQRFSEPDGELNPFLRLLDLKKDKLTETQWSQELEDIFLKLSKFCFYHTGQSPKVKSKQKNLDLTYKVNTVLAVDISKFFVDFAPMVYLNLDLKVTNSTVWLSCDNNDGFQFYVMAERNRLDNEYVLFTIAYQHPKLHGVEMTHYDKTVLQNICAVFGPLVVENKNYLSAIKPNKLRVAHVSVNKPYFDRNKKPLRPYDSRVSVADFYEPPILRS